MLALLFRQVNLPQLYINICWVYCLGRSISLRYNKQMLALLFRQVNLPQCNKQMLALLFGRSIYCLGD